MACVFIIVFLLYFLTLSPTINSFDAAEMVSGAYTLGIIHAPGYPLYLIIAHLMTALPWGSPVYNVNLLSAFFAAATVSVIFVASREISSSLICALVAAWILAFSRLFWSQAVIAGVYTLNTLLLSIWLLFFIKLTKDPNNYRVLLFLLFVIGLSITHHPSGVLLLPGLLPFALNRIKISMQKILTGLLFFCVPFLIYLYFPIRFRAEPALNYVGQYFDVNLSSFKGVVWMVTGRMFASEMLGRSFVGFLQELALLLQAVWLNLFGAGLLLAVYGLILLSRKPVVAFFYTCGVIFVLAFYASYDVTDNADMILPAIVLLTPLIAYGLSQLSLEVQKKWQVHTQLIRNAGLIALLPFIVLLPSINWNYADRGGDWAAYDFANSTLASVEPGSLILTQWTKATPLLYMQLVEKQRPDVEIIDRGLLVLGIRDTYLRSGNNYANNHSEIATDYLKQLIRVQLPHRAIYITEDDPALRLIACYERVAVDLYRINSIVPCSSE